MPVPSQVGRIGRHCDVVADTDSNPVVTARADVGLGCLVGLYSSHLDGPEASIPQAHRYPSNAHTSRPMAASTAATTNT